MRINMSIDRYDILALNEIYQITDKLNRKSSILEELGIVIQNKMKACADEFTSINYTRVQIASADYCKKMRLMRTKLEELSKSCHDLAEKIADIWA